MSRPGNTPYEGGTFNAELLLPDQYPMNPPKVVFCTKIYHPNIDNLGRICLDILKDKWSPALQIRSVLLSIQALLSSPNPDDPLNNEAAELWKRNEQQALQIDSELSDLKYKSNPNMTSKHQQETTDVQISDPDQDPRYIALKKNEISQLIKEGKLSQDVYRGKNYGIQYNQKSEEQIRNAKYTGTLGPIKASSNNVRVTCRFDYNPSLCKDYHDTGYCVFGDSCLYLHDRGDYKSGWEQEQDWENQKKKKEKQIQNGKEVINQEIEEIQEELGKYEVPKICHISNSQTTQAPYSYQYFVQKDQGSAGPRFIRPSIYSFATDPNLIQQTGIPQGCIITPFAETEENVQIIDCSQPNTCMLRCSRCHGYINPYFIFTEGGNTAICNLCKQTNKVPNEYFAPINDLQERTDKLLRPELSKGVYEFIAPLNYPRKDIQQNLIMLCLEMTPVSIQSGVFAQALHTIRSVLDSFTIPERTSLSLCTYSQQLNFYSIPKDLNNDPQLIVMADLDDPYCPFPKNALFLNIQQDREKIEYLIEKLLNNSQNILQNTAQGQFFVKTASIGAVIQSIYSMLEENPCKIIAFTSQLSQIGFGKLKRRDDVKIMGGEQEKNLYIPQCNSYKELSQNLLKKSISVDLFVFAPDYCDLATISLLLTVTGGSLYYFPQYNSAYDGEKIHYQLFRILTRNYGQDCIMTLRASPGIILEEFFTGKGKVSVRDLQMSALDSDQSIESEYWEQISVGSVTNDDKVLMPNTIAASVDKLISNGIYLIDNGEVIYLYVQKDASLEFIEGLLGVQEYEQIKGVLQFPNFPENQISQKVNAIVDQLRKNKNGAYQSIHVVSYKDVYEQDIRNILIEDEVRG
ncbi:hypothetical protein IMG5_151710, partial [Ichthyophthirius multifiliis]